MTQPKVLVTPHLLDPEHGPHLEPLRAAGLEIIYPPTGCDTLIRENISRLLTADVAAILASTEPLTRDVLADSSLRVIARMGVGYDSVEVPAATELGIAVTITPGTLEQSVAEQAAAMLLALTRGIIPRDHDVRQGNWVRSPLPRLAGRVFGLVGMGRIGRAVIPVMRGLGMRLICVEPNPDRLFADQHNVELVDDLDTLLQRADVVSLHLPCTPATMNLIDARALNLMKSTAILVNTSRGGLVDEDDLVEALRNETIYGAALDVFRQEPLPTDSPLLDCPRVVTSTHMGGIDQDSQRLAGRLAAQCIADLSQGTWPTECIVNREVQSTWRWNG